MEGHPLEELPSVDLGLKMVRQEDGFRYLKNMSPFSSSIWKDSKQIFRVLCYKY